MEQYINKSALVVEIERLKDSVPYFPTIAEKEAYKEGVDSACCKVSSLEVKEVNLEKETTNYLLYEHRSPLNEIMHKADLKSEIQYHKDIENAFKAGFELGMLTSNKAQKGKKV